PGVKVAQIEQGRISTSHPKLPKAKITEDRTYLRPLTTANLEKNKHAAAVAGVIRSADKNARGIAPDARLWHGRACVGNIPQRHPWLDSRDGTSMAAAMVSGAAALVMERAPWLKGSPEAVRALLIATAVHNLAGDRRLSDKDGTGGLSVDRADEVAAAAAML